MYDQKNYNNTPSATSSQESGFGPSPCATPGSATILESGQEVARASLSHRQVKQMGLMTSGTCGQLSNISSASADLQLSLENKLRARTQILGSTLYKMTWKPWVTPSGRSRSRLRASVRRTSETDCTGWPTPTTPSGGQVPPQGTSLTGRTPDGKKVQVTLKDVAGAVVSGWPTPSSALVLAKPNVVIPKKTAKDPQVGLADVANIVVAGYPTPTRNDSIRMPAQDFAKTPNMTLNHVAVLSGWVTPSARDWKDTPGMSTSGVDPDGSSRQRIDQLPRQAAQMDFGAIATGSPSGMGKSARLNPALPRWLMGIPPSWDASAPTVMPSTRSKPKNSSGRG